MGAAYVVENENHYHPQKPKILLAFSVGCVIMLFNRAQKTTSGNLLISLMFFLQGFQWFTEVSCKSLIPLSFVENR
jgi:hypothetical protein